MKFEYFRQISKITQISNFMKSVQSKPSSSMRTDGQPDITNLKVGLWNFANVPKILCSVPKEEQASRLYMYL